MDFGVVLCLTELPLVTGMIPGDCLGCIVTRPTVELDSWNTLHYNHREIFKVYTLVGIYILVCLVLPGLMFTTISGIMDTVHQSTVD